MEPAPRDEKSSISETSELGRVRAACATLARYARHLPTCEIAGGPTWVVSAIDPAMGRDGLCTCGLTALLDARQPEPLFPRDHPALCYEPCDPAFEIAPHIHTPAGVFIVEVEPMAIIDPSSPRGQELLVASANETPLTQGDPPPCDDVRSACATLAQELREQADRQECGYRAPMYGKELARWADRLHALSEQK